MGSDFSKCSDCIRIENSGKEYVVCEHCGHLYYIEDRCGCSVLQND